MEGVKGKHISMGVDERLFEPPYRGRGEEMKRYGESWGRGLIRRNKEHLISLCIMLSKQMLKREDEVKKLKAEIKILKNK